MCPRSKCHSYCASRSRKNPVIHRRPMPGKSEIVVGSHLCRSDVARGDRWDDRRCLRPIKSICPGSTGLEGRATHCMHDIGATDVPAGGHRPRPALAVAWSLSRRCPSPHLCISAHGNLAGSRASCSMRKSPEKFLLGGSLGCEEVFYRYSTCSLEFDFHAQG
jgi:hypothetical protein